MSQPSRKAHLAGVALAFFLASDPAHAHGGIARAYQILEEPGNPSHVVIRSDLWGLFRSVDGGATYQYICAETYGDPSTAAENRSVVVLPGGRILIAVQFDGLHLTDDGCTFRKVDAFADRLVNSLTVHPREPETLLASVTLGTAEGVTSSIARSRDRGETWTYIPAAFPPDFVVKEIGIAPSAPTIWYATGGIVGGGLAVAVSADDGATWEINSIPSAKVSHTARLAAIHPERPDVLFAWVDGAEALDEDVADEYWLTVDGGRSWSLLFSGTGDLPGFALSPDLRYVHVSGPLEGVQEALLDRALAEGPSAFTRIFEQATWGIRWNDAGVLLIGGDNYTAKGIPAYTLASSSDRGRSQAPEMTVCDIEFTSCSPDSTVVSRCETVWAGDEDERGFDEEYLAPRCALKEQGDDAGTGSGAVAGDRQITGCGCSVPAHGRPAPTTVTLLALGISFLRRWRPKRRARP